MAEHEMSIDTAIEQKCKAEDTLVRCKVILDALGHSHDDYVGEARRATTIANDLHFQLISLQSKFQAVQEELSEKENQILDLSKQVEALCAQLAEKETEAKPGKSKISHINKTRTN